MSAGDYPAFFRTRKENGMNAVVESIKPGSPAADTIIKPGDVLRKIDCNIINDVLDYEYYSYDSRILLELTSPDGKIKLINIRKPEGTDLGIDFENYLMDKERRCANKCIFCFIDQLPEGMRESLYFKDDDVRLSFLQGNYVTLTNLSRRDIQRIIDLRISPINVSIHTLSPRLRSFMLGGRKSKRGLDAFFAMAEAGITLNCQIVCCPRINSGWKLSRTIDNLIKLGSCVNSVSVVPVGLTKHRQGLMDLQPFDKKLALQTVQQVEQYSEKCMKQRGSRVFYCADELYMMAGSELPENEFYEDYPQLENGVGMMRLFITEFENALTKLESSSDTSEGSGFNKENKYSIATGTLAYKYLINLSDTINEKYGKIISGVYAVENHFFGENITVSGLITGGDMIAQLKDKDLGSMLLIPQNMLKHGEEIFLDDVTVKELSNALGVPIRIVRQDGADLLQALTGQ